MAANEDIRAERQRGPDPYDPDRFEGEPEDDYVDDEPAPRRSGRVLPIVVASLAIFGFVVIVYYAYQQGIRAGTEQNPPIIKAEEGPSKVRPASPGGMEVPNQGMKVYELGKPGAQTASTGGVERILPKPEEPMPRPPAPPEAATAAPAPATTPPAPAAAPTTPVAPAPMAQAVPASTAAAPPVLPAPLAAGQTSAAPAASAGVVAPPPPPLPGSGQPMPAVADAAAGSGAAARPAGPAAPAPPPPAQPPRDDAQAPVRALVPGGRAPAGPQPQAAAPGAPGSQIAAAPATQTAAAKPSAGGNFAVQLRAARSAEEANQVMQAALRKYGDILSGAGQQVRPYTDPKGVTYHRVLVGSFANRNEAQGLCNDLKSRGQDCFVQTLK